MKRYILMAVALILLVASFFTIHDDVLTSTVAGEGNGENARIDSLSELRELVSFIASRDILVEKDEKNKTTSDDDAKADKEQRSEYTSVTVYEETRTHDSFKSDYISGSARINRNLTMYIDGDKTYYVSEGLISINLKYKVSNSTSSSSGGITLYDPESFGNTSKTSVDYEIYVIFDMEIYVDDGRVFVKFHKYLMDINGHQMIDMSEIFGEWVELDEEAKTSVFSAVDIVDTAGYSLILSLLNHNLLDYKKHGSNYSIKTNYDAYFDFSCPEQPAISIKPILVNNLSASKGDRDSIFFSNINNTVINVDVSGAEKMGSEDFEKFFEEVKNEFSKK